MKWKRSERKVRPHEERPVRIVADAAVSTVGLHGGRLLPLLLLDTSDRPDISELIRLHETLGPGDHTVQWGRLEEHEGTVALFLDFVRPAELFMVLEFDIVHQGILVEWILSGQGVYITEAQDANDRLIRNLDRPKVIVEVGDTGFREEWDKLFPKYLAKNFRSRGLSRSESRRASRSAIEELKKMGKMKMGDFHFDDTSRGIRDKATDAH